jgi:hypothetical protein
MFVSLGCYAVAIRHPRAHVLRSLAATYQL